MPSSAPAALPALSIVIPASNEAGYIGACLDALLASTYPAPRDPTPEPPVDILVVANGCTDATAAVARGHCEAAHARGWRLQVIELPVGSKIAALNAGDRIARGPIRVCLDADVIVSPPLLERLARTLDRPEPAYASGRALIAPPQSAISRAYARFWARLPFYRLPAPGFGVFAVNAAGRARWGPFPDIIADDTFVRLNFAPSERTEVDATYTWPVVEGFAHLVKVRRRQDRGVTQFERCYPALMRNEDKPRVSVRQALGLAIRDPIGFSVYAAVIAATRIARRGGLDWSRGR